MGLEGDTETMGADGELGVRDQEGSATPWEMMDSDESTMIRRLNPRFTHTGGAQTGSVAVQCQ